ncbi:AEC family permease [Fructilactobacillus fructivorans]|uniref:AEC family transporter n=1 Tax=Fructilactobacillus fructivorans TaxID=1614 RepID=UPI0007056142|nr:AEC family transporter [Fructilactobacillus fructivorans]KRN12771.1 AEC family permease [Fructilactobacillus fructivorans]
MGIFFKSISGILIVLIMIILGFVLAKRHWFNDDSTNLIVKLVIDVALPCYMIYTIGHDFTADTLLSTLPDLRFPVVSMLIMFGISVAIARVIRIKKYHRGLFESMFLNSNTVFVGLPVNMALFGAQSLPYVLVYYMANTTFFWTIGVYLIQMDGDANSKFDWKKTIGKILSPPLLGFIIGVILVLLRIKLPSFLMSDFQYVGNLTIPLSMMFIGISMANVNLAKFDLSASNWGILLGRFIISPSLMALLVIPTGMPILMKQVFIMQAAMPVMTNAPIVARKYGADADYASLMVTETTIISLIVLPILMVIVQQIH